MVKCEKDKIKKCVIGLYVDCLDCYKYFDLLGERKREEIENIIEDNYIKDCVLCRVIGVTNNSPLTQHHIIPKSHSRYLTGRIINHTLPICERHHRILEQIIKPLKYAMDSDMPKWKIAKHLVDEIIPNTYNSINKILEGYET